MRRVYTDDDKATALAQLTVNKGNVKRTSRDLGLPEQTVRDWWKTWQKEGIPEDVGDALPAVVDKFVTDMVRVRDLSLVALEEKIIAGAVKPGELNAIFGTLTDKILLIQGRPTSRKEVVGLPNPEQFADQLGGFLGSILSAAAQRHEEIEDANWEEQADPVLTPDLTALSPGT